MLFCCPSSFPPTPARDAPRSLQLFDDDDRREGAMMSDVQISTQDIFTHACDDINKGIKLTIIIVTIYYAFLSEYSKIQCLLAD